MRHKLKVQSQAFTDHLADALKLREEELKRMVGRDFDEKLTEERCRFKAQVAAMVGRLKGMDDAFKGTHLFFICLIYQNNSSVCIKKKCLHKNYFYFLHHQ